MFSAIPIGIFGVFRAFFFFEEKVSTFRSSLTGRIGKHEDDARGGNGNEWHARGDGFTSLSLPYHAPRHNARGLAHETVCGTRLLLCVETEHVSHEHESFCLRKTADRRELKPKRLCRTRPRRYVISRRTRPGSVWRSVWFSGRRKLAPVFRCRTKIVWNALGVFCDCAPAKTGFYRSGKNIQFWRERPKPGSSTISVRPKNQWKHLANTTALRTADNSSK